MDLFSRLVDEDYHDDDYLYDSDFSYDSSGNGGEFIKLTDRAFLMKMFNIDELTIEGTDFNTIYENVVKHSKKNEVKKFIHGIFTNPFRKSNEKSAIERKKGNLLFSSKNYYHSLRLYNESLRLAEYNSESYGLALSNRSAVFFQCKNYEACLKDVNLSFKARIPDNIKPKLFLRKAECYSKLNSRAEMITTVEELKKFLNEKLIPDKNFYINKAVSLVQSKPKHKNFQSLFKALSLPNIPEIQENVDFPGASADVAVKCRNYVNYYTVADKDLKKGTVLFVEKAVAFSTLCDNKDDGWNNVCSYCLTPVDHWIPCVQCNKAMYCSEDCKITDRDNFHKWVCSGLTTDFWTLIGKTHLSLRLAITNLDAKPSFSVKNFDLYLSNLKKSEKAIMWLSTSAIFVVAYLKKKTDFFNWLKTKSNDFSHLKDEEVELKFGCLLLQYTSFVFYHEFKMVYPKLDILLGKRHYFSEQVNFGTGFYPTISNVNNSCDPNTTFYFIKDTLVIKAATDIKAGEEITSVWFYHYLKHSLEKRSHFLKTNLKINCKCLACVDPLHSLEAIDSRVCIKCKGPAVEKLINSDTLFKCLKCDHEFTCADFFLKLLKLERDLNEILQFDGSVRKESIEKALEITGTVYSPYHQIFNEIYSGWLEYYLSEGNLQEASKYFKLEVDLKRKRSSLAEFLDFLIDVISSCFSSIRKRRVSSNCQFIVYLQNYIEEAEVVTNLIYPKNEPLAAIRKEFNKFLETSF